MAPRVPLAVLLLLGALALPATVAAATPQLSATTEPGRQIDLSGSGFAANADVTLAIQRNGAAAGTQTAHTDGAGAFTATVPAGPGLGGRYHITATAGSQNASVDVVAVETAGGNTGGLNGTPPVTDTDPAATGSNSGSPSPILPLVLVFALALAGTLALRLESVRGRFVR